jgi:hypothetical protein
MATNVPFDELRSTRVIDPEAVDRRIVACLLDM